MAHQALYTGTMLASTWKQDFSPLVLAPPVPGGELTFWQILDKAADGFEPTKFEWVEEELVPITISMTTNVDNTTATTLTTTAAQISKCGIRPGTMLVNFTQPTKKEVILVTANASGTTLTVVRDYGGFVSGSGGGTTGEAHTSGDFFRVLPTHEFEGSSVTKTETFPWRDRALAFNYYSLVAEHTIVSGSDLVREYRGSTPDNYAYQVKGVVQAMERKFADLVLRAPQVARGAAARGSMGGLLWYATQTTGAATAGAYDTTAETFSYEVFDDACLGLYNRNGLEDMDLVLCVPPAGAQVIPYIHESAMRMEYATESVRGYFANSLMTTITGARVPVVIAANLPSDSFLLLNRRAVRIHFLRGRALIVYNKPLGEGMDDYVAQRWLSELTMEFQRPLDNVVYHTGLTYSRS